MKRNLVQRMEENHAKLKSCPKHDFSIDVSKQEGYPSLRLRWQCPNCNGIVSSIDKSWYETGLKHGGNHES